MCGRYTITATPEQLAERFNASTPAELIPRYNAAPSQSLPVILNRGERQIRLIKWGLVPHWSKTPKSEYNMINARVETLTEKPSYREALAKRRCLVLADSFYEWQVQSDGKTKIPMRIMLKSGQPFAIAGLWDSWRDPAQPDADPLNTFTVITGGPNTLMESIHNRMPMILRPEDEKLWMQDDAKIPELQQLLQPYRADLMQAYPVSRKVNVTTIDDSSLIAPAVN